MAKHTGPTKRPRFSRGGKWLGPRADEILHCARATQQYIWFDESLRLDANLLGEFRVWRSTTGEGTAFDDPEVGETLYKGKELLDAYSVLLEAWESDTR